ncbi:MAG: hypothetical protein ACRDTJ_08490 [Pseudonocardiaceae bacterium]
MAKFTATHGVSFADLGIKFEYDREATGNKSSRVYSADLDTTKATALKKVSGEVLAKYGIAKSDD